MAKPTVPLPGVRAPHPPLPLPELPPFPFLARVYELTYRWVQDEWQMLDAIKKAASQNGKSRNHHAALAEARLLQPHAGRTVRLTQVAHPARGKPSR
jgi:hypothetical protein